MKAKSAFLSGVSVIGWLACTAPVVAAGSSGPSNYGGGDGDPKSWSDIGSSVPGTPNGPGVVGTLVAGAQENNTIDLGSGNIISSSNGSYKPGVTGQSNTATSGGYAGGSPEPGPLSVAGAGLFALGWVRRRRIARAAAPKPAP